MVYARHVKRHTGGGEKEVKVFACPDVHHLIPHYVKLATQEKFTRAAKVEL